MSEAEAKDHPESLTSPPTDRKPSRLWWLTAICLAFCALILYREWSSHGRSITLSFKHGHGLKNGDPLKHRGIIVGEVVKIALSQSDKSIEVQIRLSAEASGIARAGSQFWINRPIVGTDGVRALGTIFGKHVEIRPGPEDAKPQNHFTGLEKAPSRRERDPSGLEFVIESQTRGGIQPDSPVSYRGFHIGHVFKVRLSGDASHVEYHVYVAPTYRNLVRENSVFWKLSGIDASLGVTGLKIRTGTLATIATGGLAMATPMNHGKRINNGARYQLSDEPDNWIEWAPRLPLGSSWLTPDLPLPQPIEVTQHWQGSFLGIRRERSRRARALAISSTRIIAPGDLLVAHPEAKDQSTRLQIMGHELSTPKTEKAGTISSLTIPKTERVRTWPADKFRTAKKVEDCLVVIDSAESTLALSRNLLKVGDQGWLIDASFSLPQQAHGAAVVARSDGHVIGMILVDKGISHVALIPQSLVAGTE